jgi:transposase-like protein
MFDLDALMGAILNRPDLVARLRREVVGEIDDGGLVTVQRAADLVGVQPKTIRNWIAAGRLTRHGAPRRPLVLRAEVEQLRRRPTSGR